MSSDTPPWCRTVLESENFPPLLSTAILPARAIATPTMTASRSSKPGWNPAAILVRWIPNVPSGRAPPDIHHGKGGPICMGLNARTWQRIFPNCLLLRRPSRLWFQSSQSRASPTWTGDYIFAALSSKLRHPRTLVLAASGRNFHQADFEANGFFLFEPRDVL